MSLYGGNSELPLRRHCVANASNAYCSTRSRSSVCCIRQLNTSLSDAVQCHHCDVQCCRIYASVHNACDSNPSRQVACHMHQRNTSRVGAAASAQYHRAATYERNAYGSNPSPSKACRTLQRSTSWVVWAVSAEAQYCHWCAADHSACGSNPSPGVSYCTLQRSTSLFDGLRVVILAEALCVICLVASFDRARFFVVKLH